jgi:hypothetical protein
MFHNIIKRFPRGEVSHQGGREGEKDGRRSVEDSPEVFSSTA